MFSELWRRVKFLLNRSRFEEELAEEMRLHLDLRTAEEGSETTARVRFGNESLLREKSRDAWGWTFAETLWQDIRYAGRDLNSSRGFTAVAVLSLALGIGANTAIFSILNAVMLRSLPVEDPARLIQVESGENSSFTNPLWEQIRDQQTAFSGTLAYSSTRFDLSSGGVSEPVEGIWVSGDYFRVLGVTALRGRLFTKDDDRRGGGNSGAVAVISYAFWKSHFGGESGVTGKTLHLNRHPFQIIGVTPEWFQGLELDHGYGVAIPIACDPILHADGSWLDKRSTWWLRVLGRLAPGVSHQQAQARMRAISKSVYSATLPPDWGADDKKQYLSSRLNVAPAATGFSGTGSSYKTALFVLMGVVGLVLLIACANVSNLLLARAAARQRDIALRMAIGASRLRLIRQLLTESFMLAALGAGAGLLFALWGSRLLVRLLSASGKPLEFDLSLDGHLLIFTLSVATITGILFGLVPALKATRVSPNQTLKEGVQSAGTSFSRLNLGAALVVVQEALTLILLVGAGLFVSTINHILHVDAGFDTHNVLIANVDVLTAGVPKERRSSLYADMLEQLRRVPGVLSASSSALTPISGSEWNQWTYPVGKHPASQDDENVYLNRISPGYFHTMGTPMLLGRDFSERDSLAAPKTIVLSETTARTFFGAESPLGKMVGMENEPDKPRDLFRVIGVVKDAKYEALNQGASFKTAFLSASQDAQPWSAVCFEIRSSRGVEGLQPRIRDAITKANQDVSIEFQSFETQVNDSVRQQQVVALLSAFFGALALLLAIMGLYGVTAYSVARRQSEIGIRMALGAQKTAVLWLVMRSVWLMLAIGTLAGTAAALMLGRLVAGLLFGVAANDPVTLAMAALVLATAATVAAFLPARRAASLDPMRALRNE
jgi:predicted permease